MSGLPSFLLPLWEDVTQAYRQAPRDYPFDLRSQEVGRVTYLGQGIARCSGLTHVQSEERVLLPHQHQGMAFNLDPTEVGIILLRDSQDLQAGCEVQRTGQVFDAPVGEALLGRVLDATGRPLDHQGAVAFSQRRPIEREAPAIMDRAPVTEPLQTGIKVIDALIPVGRGQRMLILGDRQTGKTAIAVDTILNQRGKNVVCVYCAIGQRISATAKLIQELRQRQAMDNCVVVVAGGDTTPGLQYITPYAATTMAEYFMEQGRDVLIIYDDLTQHARAYRELSLLLRRPPGREAFPGDIFYIHARLLERATHLRSHLGGGTLTALPIVETEAQNLAAYIPTNLVSITDGQIYLTPKLFQKGIFPAVDVGKSVSRVGGKAQRPAYKAITGDLRLTYSQFEELESFARFGTRLEASTQQTLERGRRVRAILQQPQFAPVPVAEQVAVLLAVNQGLLDPIPLEQMALAQETIRRVMVQEFSSLCDHIQQGKSLTAADQQQLLQALSQQLPKALELDPPPPQEDR
ncbi:alternate F1F0 ATPase, F1 subunit alpha [Lyngbya confervoides]|uniref:alternate F1F0 ATPase, F1 subunit alpha n=1 Tax=Lyngbya confervoides TaxID=207921 RepID=UPI00140CE7CC|nr:alternate F1F0 ATPase, F1 subunit alpha [Lyngbya confervoides]